MHFRANTAIYPQTRKDLTPGRLYCEPTPQLDNSIQESESNQSALFMLAVKSQMDSYKTLILILFGLSSISCSHFPLRKYFYISSPKTWEDAQLYCREKHTDLATFESIEEVNQPNRPATISGRVWFGLHDDPTSWKGTLGNDSNSWRWSTTGQKITSEYHNWRDTQPDYWQGTELCVLMESDSTWKDVACSLYHPFICYTDMGQNQKTYTFFSTPLTWNQAQAYCREHHTDLALITSAEENAMAKSAAGWIGLYRIPWTWSDTTPISFTNWVVNKPDSANFNQHCGAENGVHEWNDDVCGNLKPFICHEVRKAKTTMKPKMKTTADLTDPVVQEQMLQKLGGTFTSQGWTKFKLQWTTLPQSPEN